MELVVAEVTLRRGDTVTAYDGADEKAPQMFLLDYKSEKGDSYR